MNEDIAVQYRPTPDEATARTLLYKNLEYMRDLKNRQMPQFQSGPNGQRSWLQMLDDSEAMVNVYTPSREEAGKGDWQSNANVAGAEIRAKMRAVAAGVGLKVPEMEFAAVNENGIRSMKRAEIFKNIVRQTYAFGNPALSAFLETWQMLAHGVVFEYEGYKTGGAMQETVESFDTLTGVIKTKKEYVKMDGEPFNVLINPQEFYWWTFFCRDVQKQPRLSWVQKYTRREIELEFSKYKNYKFIRSKKDVTSLRLQETTFFTEWGGRVDDEEFEVFRTYSKEDDGSTGLLKGYEVWINGIPILRCPLLWGEKEKVYPFSKQVPEYFANSNFFVGPPFAIILEGYGDNKNMLVNSLVDKVARGLDPLKLVGLQNRDLLDVESEIHTADSTIYVPDITAVKFMDAPQVNQGELMLMQMLDKGIELISIDRTQQGQTTGTRKTAREVVVADQRAQELKGNLYLSLEDLWLQKTRLRISVILSHFLKDKAAADSVKGQIISIKDYTFSDGTRGTLDIQIAATKGKLLDQKEIEAREDAAKQEGQHYKLVSMLRSFIDDWHFDFTVVPASLKKQDDAAKHEELMGEIDLVTKLFPEFFVANKDVYLGEILSLRGKHPDEFNPPAPPQEEKPKVSESLNYKDAPPDVRRQIEAQAGLKPSTSTEISPLAPEPPAPGGPVAPDVLGLNAPAPATP